jgi:rhomboid protease GluP
MTFPEPSQSQTASGYSDRRAAWKPVATYALMAITTIIYLLQMVSQFVLGGDYLAAIGMKVNSLIIQGQLWRLVTPVFLHANILHIAFNMYALYVIGPFVERFYGRGRFLALYFIAGFTGNVGSFLFSSANSLGASTAIFGLLAAEGVFFYQNRGLFGKMARSSLINVIMIAAVNLIIGLSPGIDNWGHLGGLIGGVAFAWFAGPRYRHPEIITPQGLVDERGIREALTAGIIVCFLFAVLAGLKIYQVMP